MLTKMEIAMKILKERKFDPFVHHFVKSAVVNSAYWNNKVAELAWEAATALISPDDNPEPERGFKIKCIGTGSRADSSVFKGLVFTKDVAHGSMSTNHTPAKLLLIQDKDFSGSSPINMIRSCFPNYGSAEYINKMQQRYQPDIIVVEGAIPDKVVKDIVDECGVTIVSAMERRRMQRVAEIGSVVNSASSNKNFRQLDSFQIIEFKEDANTVDEGNKQVKRLMFLEDSRNGFGCTILLMGPSLDELKEVKHVVRCATVIAYRLMLEAQFILKLDKNFDIEPWSYDDRTSDQDYKLENIKSLLDNEGINIFQSITNYEQEQDTVCEEISMSHYNFYRATGCTLWRVMERLLNEDEMCRTCGRSPLEHRYYYGHSNRTAHIEIKRLSESLAPDESLPPDENLPPDEGICMYSRCSCCSDPKKEMISVTTEARALPFGKFFELFLTNFSNPSPSCHGADFVNCFRSGHMVAELTSNLTKAYSVCLPLLNLSFESSTGGEFRKQEFEEVCQGGITMLKKFECSLNTLNNQSPSTNFSYIIGMLKEDILLFENLPQNVNILRMFSLQLNRVQLEVLLKSLIWKSRLDALSSSNFNFDVVKDYPVWKSSGSMVHICIEDLRAGFLPDLIDDDSRIFLPIHDSDDYVVSDYEGELSSIIACSLAYLDTREKTMSRSQEKKDHHAGSSGGDSKNLRRICWLSASSGESSDGNDSDIPASLIVPHRHKWKEVSLGSRYKVRVYNSSDFRGIRLGLQLPENEFIASLSRCKNFNSQGGKSGGLFLVTCDERFILKEIKPIELDAFLDFSTRYFSHMDREKTCLIKILGIYQVVISGQKPRNMLVQENLYYGKQVSKKYDLKGAVAGRYVAPRVAPLEGEEDDVYLDKNFINHVSTPPLFVRNKEVLMAVIGEDTDFLESVNIMDYSLLVGFLDDTGEVICGIVDYLRKYTLDKQVESVVKSVINREGIAPTIISPGKYRERFISFMDSNFIPCPEPCSPKRLLPALLDYPRSDISQLNSDEVDSA